MGAGGRGGRGGAGRSEHADGAGDRGGRGGAGHPGLTTTTPGLNDDRPAGGEHGGAVEQKGNCVSNPSNPDEWPAWAEAEYGEATNPTTYMDPRISRLAGGQSAVGHHGRPPPPPKMPPGHKSPSPRRASTTRCPRWTATCAPCRTWTLTTWRPALLLPKKPPPPPLVVAARRRRAPPVAGRPGGLAVRPTQERQVVGDLGLGARHGGAGAAGLLRAGRRTPVIACTACSTLTRRRASGWGVLGKVNTAEFPAMAAWLDEGGGGSLVVIDSASSSGLPH